MDNGTRRAANEARRKSRKSRGRGIRRTTGCLTCRRRHLKCDEERPVCGPCSKSDKTCAYSTPATDTSTTVSETTQLDNVVLGSLSPALSTRRSPFLHNAPTSEPCRASPVDLDREQAASGLVHLNAAGLITHEVHQYTNTGIPQLANQDQPSFQAAPTPPNVAFHRWLGLLANDAPQSPTPTVFVAPIISNVSPNDASAGSGPYIRSATTTLSEGTVNDSPIPPASLQQVSSNDQISWRGSEPAQLSQYEQSLFSNFIDNVSGWIDLHDPMRCFSIFVPHLALHDAGLMNAILALSARQLSISHSASVEQRNRQIGLQYYFTTLRYLQKAMHYQAYTVSLELLATALIVSMYEMLDDFASGWERHLEGVFWIQRSQVIHGESGGLKQAVWWAWQRQDVWAAFRERRKTLSFWQPTQTLNTMNSFELARRAVWIFAKAVDYCSKEEVSSEEVNVQARIERAESLFALLDEWRSNLTIEFTPIPEQHSASLEVFPPIKIHPPAFGVSLQFHFAARILVFLYKPSLGGVRGNFRRQKLLSEAAKSICGIAATLSDAASSLISSQCLYIAGLCIQDQRQREVILSLIDDAHRRTGWPTQSLSGDLKDEWRTSDCEFE